MKSQVSHPINAERNLISCPDQLALAVNHILGIYAIEHRLRRQNEADNFTTDDRDKKIQAWLNPPDPLSNYSAAQAKHEPLTGSWFLKSAEFLKWKETTERFIWISGIRKSDAICISIYNANLFFSWLWQDCLVVSASNPGIL